MKKHILCTVMLCCAIVLNSCGALSKPVYVNDDFDIGFIPLGSMAISDEDELAAVSSAGNVCELIATVNDTGSAAIVSILDDVYGGADAYLEILKSSLELDDYSISYGDVTNAMVAGEEYSVLNYSIEAMDITMSVATYARSEEEKLLLLNISYADEAELNRIVGCFVEAE